MNQRSKWTDRLIDGFGAVAAGGGAAVSAWLAAVDVGAAPVIWSAAGGLVGVIVGMLAMRAVHRRRPASLPSFYIEAFAFEEPSEELLLDDVVPEPDALLLEDVLVSPDHESRVVQLFAPDAILTPGQLRARIDRHLSRGDEGDWAHAATPGDDASAALNAALLDIRRTLRRH